MSIQIAGNPEGTEQMTEAQGVEAAMTLLGYTDNDDKSAEEPTTTEESEDEEGDPAEEAQEESQDEEPTESDDEDEEPAEEEEQEEADPEPDSYTVRVDGEDVEVTLDELKAGYSRQADYTRKTTEVSRQSKELQAELAGVQAERAKYAAGLDKFLEHVEGVGRPKPPDADKVEAGDPAAVKEWIQYQKAIQEVAAAQQERQRLIAEEQGRIQLAQQQAVAEGLETLKSQIPGWSDDAKRTADSAAIRSHALAMGLSEELLDNITDPGVIKILYQSYKYGSLQEKTKVKAKARKGKPLKAGAKRAAPEGTTAKIKDLQARFDKTGDPTVAAELYYLKSQQE